jgi:hypothetical protein
MQEPDTESWITSWSVQQGVLACLRMRLRPANALV